MMMSSDDSSTETGGQRRLSRRLALFLVVGLAIRFICAPLLTYDYDIYHWAVIMQNIDSGNGLYELTGYFYTPVWGYIMGAILMFWNLFLRIDVFGMKFTSFLGIEDMEHIYHISTITSPEFNIAMKVPLILVDVLVGYLVYRLTMDMTGDKRKSEYAFGLWFLCPIILYMSGVQAMFDNISALFLLLCIMFVLKDRYFIAGVFLALATLLKLFPVVCAFVLILYVLKRYSERKDVMMKLGLAVAGGIVAVLVIMMPNIIQGNLDQTLTLITDRSDRYGIRNYLLYMMGLIFELFIAYRFYKEDNEDLDRKLVRYILYATVCSMAFAYAPQYVIVVIPFLVVTIQFDKGYRICWWLIGIGAMISALALNNFSLLSSVSAFWNLIPADTVISLMHAFEAGPWGLSAENILNAIGFVLEYVGMVLAILIMMEGWLVGKYPSLISFFDRIRKGPEGAADA